MNSGSFCRAWSAGTAKRGGEGAKDLKRDLTSSGNLAGRRVSVLIVTQVLQQEHTAGARITATVEGLAGTLGTAVDTAVLAMLAV